MNKKQAYSIMGHYPELSLFMVRLGVGLLFFVPGTMKFMHPHMFQAMLEDLFNVTGGLMILLYWIVVLLEIVGGVLIVLGKLFPKVLYKISILGLLSISLVALFLVHIPAGETFSILFQSLATLCIAGLWFSDPMYP